MNKNVTFLTLISLLLTAGCYGVYSIIQQQDHTPNPALRTQQATLNPSNNTHTQTIPEKWSGTNQTISHGQSLADVTKLLEKGQYNNAVELVNSHYQLLSTQDLEGFEQLFLNSAYKLWQTDRSSEAVALLADYNEAFNSLDGWRMLSNLHLEKQDWKMAIHTLLNATALEYQPDKLNALRANLISAASSQRALLESKRDVIGINSLYKMLYQRHPDDARIQLELASSYLSLNDIEAARGLLEPLQYDGDYGDIAKTKLAQLTSNVIATTEQRTNNTSKQDEIVVPLLRSGNSFFANTAINNRQHRLLLDTGASITALSTRVIDSLGLKSTGKSIQLNTANGTTLAPLYLVNQLKLGGLTIKNVVIAEIQLDDNSQFHGLLGTDLLNQLDTRYSYVIDNQRNALIFKSKPH